MKRVWSVILIAVMLVMLCACAAENGQQAELRKENEETRAMSATEVYEEDEAEMEVPEEEYPAETENAGYPPEGEYDEIVARDERYLLCKKTELGFDVNAVLYGIYDSQEQRWALDYQEYEDISDEDIVAHGDGMFSYDYLGYTGSMRAYFLSAELGGSFKMDDPWVRDMVRFVNGKAFVLISQDTHYVGGTISPNTKLCWLTTLGDLEEVEISEFGEDDMFYWNEGYIIGDDCLFALDFESYEQNQRYIYIYFYNDDSYTIIDNQDYITRLTCYLGNNNNNSNVTFENGLIRIDNIEGDDGILYYAEFDREGNLVTSATPMY